MGYVRHISVSQMEMLTRCGQQWVYRYVEKLKRPPGIAAYTGRGVHKSIEANLGHVIDMAEMLERDHVLDVARDAINADWDKESPLLTPEERKTPVKTLRGDCVDRGVLLSGLHYDQVAPGIEPLHLERRFVLDIPNFPFGFVGIIDLQEPQKLRDTKTKSKAPTQQDADRSLQLTAYHLGAQVLDGTPPEVVQIDALVSTKKPKVVHLPSTRTEADHRRFLRRLEVTAEVIEKEAFLPAPEDAWCCSPKYCGYWDICPFGAKGRAR